VNFRKALATRFKKDGKPWHPLWRPVPFLVIVIVFNTFQAANEHDSASRQRTSSGVIGQCENSWRSGNHCHYTFSVGDSQYTGASEAALGAFYSQRAAVYYDSQDPTVNALRDFSEQSRKSKRFGFVMLSALVAILIVIFLDGLPNPEA
jgi:hypothetical protein